MTLTNAYASIEQVKAAAGRGQTDVGKDDQYELALNAASRQIDAWCGRRFWQDSAVVAREYEADDATCVYVDDISTTTGLIVKVDTDGDGTYETTLTASDYRLWPSNAADMVPVEPYTRLLIPGTSSSYLPRWGLGVPGVQITAKFGWPAIPDDVTQACVAQAVLLYKSAPQPGGLMSVGVDGFPIRAPMMHPVAVVLLERFQKPRVG